MFRKRYKSTRLDLSLRVYPCSRLLTTTRILRAYLCLNAGPAQVYASTSVYSLKSRTHLRTKSVIPICVQNRELAYKNGRNLRPKSRLRKTLLTCRFKFLKTASSAHIIYV
uniref:Uncharacterized protein n=1 Tax=Cacopsylla melanoneura TaxID=428564 RepID=A0A8D8QZQ5_9HEMI